MTEIQIEDLHQWLQDHRKEIDYVYLEWRWETTVMFESDTYYGVVDGESRYPLYHKFYGWNLDEEYSFAGNVEDAISFAEGYTCWDGHTFQYDSGVLFAEEDAIDYANEYPDDADTLDTVNMANVSYFGLYYHYWDHNGNQRDAVYKGPLHKWGDDKDEEEGVQ